MTDDILKHYGVKRRSGRYPWGSGKDSFQRGEDFLARVENLSKNGISEKELAEQMGMTTTDLRLQMKVAKHERRRLQADRARSLRDDGKSLNEITKEMGFKNDSSVRALLDENTASNKNKAVVTADILKKELEAKGDMLDVGAGVDIVLGVSPSVLKEAIFILETEGYNKYGVGLPQPTNIGKQTNTVVLAKPDVEYKEAYNRPGDIKTVDNYHSTDGGDTFDKKQYPASISSDRVFVRYGDKGGSDRDGTIEIRKGVDDLSLGNSHYAQVRVLVDGSHYLKGMAMYSDDIPDGYDIVFNTNKTSEKSKLETMKAIKTDDPMNPFGAYIKANGQSTYDAPDGTKKLSAINKLKEEGDWDKMSKNLSSQFLSKQPMKLIKSQLDLTYKDADASFDEIMSLTNPTVKKKMLLDFANQCDGAAVHLKSAALPGQTTQVILPLPKIKETEVYAPNYANGTTLSLVRYPHGGIFEIPELVVNNKNASGKSIIGPTVKDAIGINPKVAEQLSGADFDGDTVIAIPSNSKIKIKTQAPLKGLKDFDAKVEYSTDGGKMKGVKYMTKSNTQKEMGMVSNLITDMTIRGANEQELTRAVKHSMVVIDAEKHKLNYKQSEKDNGIAALKKKYQGYTNEEGKEVGGASTLLSRRKQTTSVPERQGSGRIDKETGKVIFKESGRQYIDQKGNTVYATTKVKKILNIDDVHEMSSGYPQEKAYADYANKMKSLANKARKEYTSTGNMVYNPDAKKKYQTEVDSLNAKLKTALLNAPKERNAIAITNSKIKALQADNPGIDKKELKKIKQQTLEDARASVGASSAKVKISFTDTEWEAIQAGAVTDTNLSKMLKYADDDVVKALAMPKSTTTLSKAAIAKARAMSNMGYTNAEIAQAIGKSATTVANYVH